MSALDDAVKGKVKATRELKKLRLEYKILLERERMRTAAETNQVDSSKAEIQENKDLIKKLQKRIETSEGYERSAQIEAEALRRYVTFLETLFYKSIQEIRKGVL